MPVTEKGSLDCRKLVLCSAHGNDLDCLSTDKNRGCDVKWTPGDIGRYWDRLAMAMMEGLAWRAGKRVYVDRFEYVQASQSRGTTLMPAATCGRSRMSDSRWLSRIARRVRSRLSTLGALVCSNLWGPVQYL